MEKERGKRGGEPLFMPGTGCCRRRRPNIFAVFGLGVPGNYRGLCTGAYQEIAAGQETAAASGGKTADKKVLPSLRGSVERRRRRRLRVRFFAPLVNNLASTPLSLKI